MALKKPDLHFSLWASCDELRSGMDASQYKVYVLFMLFIKYISDKYGKSDNFSQRELVEKTKDLMEYVVVHELKHLIAPTLSAEFFPLMSKHYPAWRETRAELYELPLAAEAWLSHRVGET